MITALLTAWAALLLALSVADPERRADLFARDARSWALDLMGLLVQGVGVPALRLGVVVVGLGQLAPTLQQTLQLSPVISFCMCFIITDFMYYFNHRALHGAALWPLHAVHHEPSRLDLFVSSRNTLWTNGLFVYLWVDGAWWFLLADPRPLAAAMATSAGLDLWRHSRLDPPEKIARWLRPWLILPADHERHHGHDAPLGNLGANLKVWDRLFGTLLTPEVPARTGRHTGLSLWRAWLWPFARP